MTRVRYLSAGAALAIGVLLWAAAPKAGPVAMGDPEREQAAAPPAGARVASDASVAIFAGGCFWCMEGPFDELDGVLDTTSGYTGGKLENPSYEQVSSGTTGHTEAASVTYDPDRVSYRKLLAVFWRNIDPTDARGQFCDKGSQYRSGIYWQDAEQRRLAEDSRDALVASGRLGEPIATEIVEAGAFYPAEETHQDYYRKNPLRYGFYRRGCGRDRRLREVWGDEAGGAHGAGEHAPSDEG